MKIIWTESAQKSQDAAASYIFNEFGAMPLIDFYKNLDEIEEDLSDFPELGRIEPLLQDRSKSYRSLVATKYNKISITWMTIRYTLLTFGTRAVNPKRKLAD